MRKYKVSSGDMSTDPLKYLHHIPLRDRVRANHIRIEREKGTVKLWEGKILIYEKQ